MGTVGGYSRGANDWVTFEWRQRDILDQRLTGVDDDVSTADDDGDQDQACWEPVVVHLADRR